MFESKELQCGPAIPQSILIRLKEREERAARELKSIQDAIKALESNPELEKIVSVLQGCY